MTYLRDPQSHFLVTMNTNTQRKYMCVQTFIFYIYISIPFPTILVIKSRLANIRKKEINIYESVMMFWIKHSIYLTLTVVLRRRFCYLHFAKEETQLRGVQTLMTTELAMGRSGFKPKSDSKDQTWLQTQSVFIISPIPQVIKGKKKKRLSCYPKVSS